MPGDSTSCDRPLHWRWETWTDAGPTRKTWWTVVATICLRFLSIWKEWLYPASTNLKKIYYWCSWSDIVWYCQSDSLGLRSLHVVMPESASIIWVYPQNAQFVAHLREFMTGYRSSAEAVQVKFPHVDGTRSIKPWTVGYNDGQLKVLCMMGLVSFIHELVTCLKIFEMLCFVFCPKRWFKS